MVKINGLEPMIISMVVALPRSFMPNKDQPYCEEELEELKQSVVAKILLTKKKETLNSLGPMEINEIEGSVQIIKRPNMADKVILTKPNIEMKYHLKPLFA
ncbi:hypothetical protein ACH5RR_026122 [Cinchona calisaya]|uniref:Uncharacterized protein n=1 Tax=Cinchona calisaya TaxID=153742 RepID=A0ABD2Z507_9GENT